MRLDYMVFSDAWKYTKNINFSIPREMLSLKGENIYIMYVRNPGLYEKTNSNLSEDLEYREP